MGSVRFGIFDRDVLKGTLYLLTAFLLAAQLPWLGSFFFVLIPLPVLYYYSRFGRFRGSVMFLIAMGAMEGLMRIQGQDAGGLPFLLLGCLGIILAELLRKKMTLDRTILWLVLSGVVIILAPLLVSSFVTGQSPVSILKGYVSAGLKENIDMYASFDAGADSVQLLKDHAEQIITFLVYASPGFLFSGLIFLGWINILMGWGLFVANRIPFPDFGDLTLWKVPDKLVWFLIATGWSLVIPVPEIRVVGMNGLIVCLFLYLLQGLAIVEYFFKHRRLPRLMWYIFYFLLVIQQLLLLLVAAAGLLDLWLNFRKPRKSPDTDNDPEDSPDE